jgi:hypothetical protein
MVFKTKNTKDEVGKGREGKNSLGSIGGKNAFTKKRIHK